MVIVAAETKGLNINIAKTKVKVLWEDRMTDRITRGNRIFQIIWIHWEPILARNNDCSREIKLRIAKATGAMAGFNSVWKRKSIGMYQDKHIEELCVALRKRNMNNEKEFPEVDYNPSEWDFIYVCRVAAENLKHRDIWKRFQAKTNIMHTIVESKMNFLWHSCKMEDNRMIKKLMLGTLAGCSWRGRLRMEWFENITEWEGADLPIPRSLEVASLHAEPIVCFNPPWPILAKATQIQSRQRSIVNQLSTPTDTISMDLKKVSN
jgi:hypothetical protein